MNERRLIMPVLSGDRSRRVHVDANAVIDYIRERALYNLGMRPTSYRMEIADMRKRSILRHFV